MSGNADCSMLAAANDRLPRMPDSFPSAPLESLAIFRALQLGDLLCAVPALRALRAGFPAARITLVGLPWAARFAERFKRYLDEFVAFPGHPALPEQPVRRDLIPVFRAAMHARRLDLAVQLHGSGGVSNRVVRSFGARALAGYFPADAAPPADGTFIRYPDTGPEPLRLLRLPLALGAPACGHHLEFPLNADDDAELRASGLAAGLAPGAYVCIHPGARSRDKCWPPHCFAALADRLAAEFGLAAVLTGSAAEADLTAAVAARMHSPAVDAAAPISIGAMAALLSRARLLVCNDTGVSHIAAGLRLPSVVVFGKTDMCRWAPLDRRLHRCIRDPGGRRVEAVVGAARRLLGGGRE